VMFCEFGKRLESSKWCGQTAARSPKVASRCHCDGFLGRGRPALGPQEAVGQQGQRGSEGGRHGVPVARGGTSRRRRPKGKKAPQVERPGQLGLPHYVWFKRVAKRGSRSPSNRTKQVAHRRRPSRSCKAAKAEAPACQHHPRGGRKISRVQGRPRPPARGPPGPPSAREQVRWSATNW